MTCLYPVFPIRVGAPRGQRLWLILSYSYPMYGSMCSRCSDNAGKPVPGSACRHFICSAFLISNMSFSLNLCYFHWILQSFDSKVHKRQTSHQLVHGLQKSCACVCVCELSVTVSHFWLHFSHPQPALVLYFHSFFSFPFWSTSEGEKTSSYYYICTCQILC